MKTYKQLQERINMARAKMGDVIKDFQASDAPQFKGKSKEKRRQMAIAAKMAAEEVEQIDELSKETLASYAGKAAKDFAERKPKMGYKGQLKKMQNRSVGVGRALDKVYGEEVEQIEESDLKPFIVVHAKHGKFETHAASTYEAAKNAAAHWKTKKGTAGMDVHRADITHSTQHVG